MSALPELLRCGARPAHKVDTLSNDLHPHFGQRPFTLRIDENCAKISVRSRFETVQKSPETQPKLRTEPEPSGNGPYMNGETLEFVLTRAIRTCSESSP